MDVYMARQPIFDLENNVYAYELLYRSNAGVNSYTGSDGDASTADVISNTFFNMNMDSIIGNSKAFINFTGNLLKRGMPKMIPPEILVVEVLENIVIDSEIIDACKELKSLGYTLALDDFVYHKNLSELFELGDIIKIDFRTPKKVLEDTAYICRYSNKTILGEKIETRDEFEYAKTLGCTFAQGYYFAKPDVMTKHATTPMSQTFMQTLSLISQPDPDIDQIVSVISRDSALTQRLLRLINSVAFSSRNKISTINQALVLLGLENLREWVYLMGLQRVNNSDNEEVLQLSLFMAKFCEKVAMLLPETKANSNEFYLMGLLSTVSYGGDVALSRALEEFPVTDRIKNGLMGTGGAYSDIYKLGECYEKGEWDKVDTYAEKYGLDRSKLSEIYMASVKEAEGMRTH